MVLAVILAVLGAGIFYFQTRNHNTSITNLKPATISTIRVFSSDLELLNLKKIQNHWNILINKQYHSANQQKIHSILNLLKAPVIDSFNAEAGDMAKYGFNKAHLRIKFDALEIRFGDVNPLNNLRYLKIDDSIYIIKDEYYRLLLSKPQDLRQ